LEKDLIIISGRNEDAVGKPLIYATSKSFMDYFGINSASDLPKINEVLMEELVRATVINPAETETESEEQIIDEIIIEETTETTIEVAETPNTEETEGE